jgi:hypothetical protein
MMCLHVVFLRMSVNGTGSGSCPVAGFGTRGVERSGSATRDMTSGVSTLVTCFLTK